ncbi:FAD oxidoreductase [Culex quinquefasciatus]|uniref:FAD oxidoreductase n=1 Tax=Culex quinquefasciatus TaxID=7176 RepID=B0WHP6_CULQU|nr:FAD oxidoreductase [Culex quinquefasciatus]|eukprot:XP_001848230.1 FAD oxidoreductase [Culex quinquefasciatus]
MENSILPKRESVESVNNYLKRYRREAIGGGCVGALIAYWLKKRAQNRLNVIVVKKDATYQGVSLGVSTCLAVLPQLHQWLSSSSLPSIHHLVAVSFNSAADDCFLSATVLLSLILLVTGVLTGGTSGHRDIDSNLLRRTSKPGKELARICAKKYWNALPRQNFCCFSSCRTSAKERDEESELKSTGTCCKKVTYAGCRILQKLQKFCNSASTGIDLIRSSSKVQSQHRRTGKVPSAIQVVNRTCWTISKLAQAEDHCRSIMWHIETHLDAAFAERSRLQSFPWATYFGEKGPTRPPEVVSPDVAGRCQPHHYRVFDLH